ncbi:GNAT family N-acetyltransferase [Limibaculum sp. M0105]|uniref:GNAT family N-acetyltransferase n=1 Tax=Thermohalobaculum xanthum TaxID=2753746 RepID=A0A8J7SI92_9RHOB|nr:GNAT family N-acetyltransferase [Thermohalobaculum xanthum]MBK0400190.1 GNAT family N-acetyltransferase [Thermohalobaculum xanthum]
MLGIGDRSYRLLAPGDIPAARAHLEAFDTEDLFHHFHQFMEPEHFDAWAERALGHDLVGCFEKGRLVGMAEIAYDGPESEIALSVDPARRRHGIGTQLFERACARARSRGALRAAVLIARGDRPMIDLAVRHDGFTAYKRGESLIMPGVRHSLLTWLIFDLEHMPPTDLFGRAVRSVRVALGLDKDRSTADLRSRD